MEISKPVLAAIAVVFVIGIGVGYLADAAGGATTPLPEGTGGNISTACHDAHASCNVTILQNSSKGALTMRLIGSASEKVRPDTAQFLIRMTRNAGNASATAAAYENSKKAVMDTLESYGIRKEDVRINSYYELDPMAHRGFFLELMVKTDGVAGLDRLFKALRSSGADELYLYSLGVRDATKEGLSKRMLAEAVSDAKNRSLTLIGDSAEPELADVEELGYENNDLSMNVYELNFYAPTNEPEEIAQETVPGGIDVSYKVRATFAVQPKEV